MGNYVFLKKVALQILSCIVKLLLNSLQLSSIIDIKTVDKKFKEYF